jgi:hypothetical protein
MTFANMFENCIDDRPSGLIILELGDCKFRKKKELEVSLKSVKDENSPTASTILIFKGKPKPLQMEPLDDIFDLAPKYFSYQGVFSEHLKACDQLFGLVNELPLNKEAKEALKNHDPKGFEKVKFIESKISRSRRITRTSTSKSTSLKRLKIGSDSAERKRTRTTSSKSVPNRGQVNRKNPPRSARKNFK